MTTPRSLWLPIGFAAALTLVAAPLALAQPPAPKSAATPAAPGKGPGIAAFMKIRTPGSPVIAPDGTMYVRDWPEGIYQLYRVEGSSAGPDSKMVKLTNYPDGLAGYSLSPDGTKILLYAAQGGNENTQADLLRVGKDMGPSTIQPLLANPKVQHAVNAWLPDSSGFIYTANDASPNDFYIYRYDLAPTGGTTPGTSIRLLGKEGSWSAADITADGSRALVAQYRSISDSSLHELDTKTGTLTDLTPKASDAATVAVEPIGYLPGETSILYTSDAEGGLNRLYMRDLKGGQVSKPISEIEAHEVGGVGMNKEKTLLGVATNEDGYGVLHLYRLPNFESVPLPAIEKGVASGADMRGNRIIWTLSNARTPGLAFTYEVPTSGKTVGSAKQVTFADTQGIDLSKFPLPELIKYKSFDGTAIPAFVFLPPGYKKGTKIPFVINYHGGPEGQSRPAFNATIQYLLSEGFGVMQPNVRGSTGYGRDFHMLDDYKNRWNSVKDGVDAAQWLVDNGYASPGKIAAYGGSYGGFMSVATIVEDQERVDSGKQKQRLFGSSINVVGIVNMKTFLEQTSGYRRKLREVEYGPLTDPDFLSTISSIQRLDKINVPMLIAHGLNDPRVPVGEAMQLAVGLKRRGLDPVELYFPDEGHGFVKLDNRLLFAERMAKFLNETIAK